ncbi:hypothetical protein ABFS82_04G143700 [Erythranthe guttata]|uniref:protein LONGIFOLIA 2 n=1 Tax=Erythranthe guttata TaxID=4155 RepID=UPI00064DDD37|nr:PREDICTED: protein LONGIFOLIA 2 [Erythranthe guttata]|eukprot:XP_012853958.1 PREDICTED: protein LONGIFOLIA 2 [Erythranthe guttata]
MAAKLLHSLTDDNPDLQKQIGCMTGIFQLFDRQNMLTGSRRIVGHTPQRLLPGNSHYDVGTLERDSSSSYIRSSSREKYPHKNTQRVSTESSRASFSSSSRSSSFSSLDCNRATQLEPASFDRMIFPETPSRDPAMTLQNSSTRQSVDLRDFVKDSIYKEIHGLSNKHKTKTEDANYRDSPRLRSKYTDNTPAAYLKEPRELLRSSSYHAKEGSSFSVVKDAPRFSYDGREINRTRFDGSNSALKLKDLPRLSLDSREGSMRNSLASDSSKPNSFLKTMQKKDSVVFNETQARPPSVVAKLMGLETLPEHVSSSNGTNTGSGSGRSYPDEEFVNNLGLFEKMDVNKPMQVPISPKNSKKEPSSPRWRNSDGSMKPMPRSPIEPAPWKGPAKSTRNQAKGPTAFPSVYSEIEKRLKDIEFTQSGKDLRALKQILEAMQAKGLLETPQEGQGSNFTSQKDHEERNFRKPQTGQVLASRKTKAVYAETYESPIVIMKPAKLVGKSGIPASSVISLDGISGLPKLRGSGGASKDSIAKSSQRDNAQSSVSTKSDRTLRTAQTSTKSQPLIKEGSNQGWGKSSGSISPRMQQKKLDLEKRSRPPTSPDSSKLKRQTNKQQSEPLNSPGGRRRPKAPITQHSDDQVSEVSAESVEIADVDSYERPPGISSNRSPSKKASQFMKTTTTLSEEESAEFGVGPTEYSSPVSVLDTVEYNQDSPVKYVGKALKVDRNSNKLDNSFNATSTESGSKKFENNRKKLQNIENLVQKLTRLNSTHDEARTDYIASLCENTNPDHRYISEILLASGLLLRDLSDFQFHQSGHPINPELFLVLEQTKGSTLSKEDRRTKKSTQLTLREKFHRKLIFDAVNEILARKFASAAGPHSEPFFRPFKVVRKALNAQKLLRELCSEIEGLEAKKNPKCGSSDEEDGGWKSILWTDVMNRSESWVDFDGEIAGPVLDIERLIFKDLVDEVVIGESAGLIIKPVRHKVFVAK